MRYFTDEPYAGKEEAVLNRYDSLTGLSHVLWNSDHKWHLSTQQLTDLKDKVIYKEISEGKAKELFPLAF